MTQVKKLSNGENQRVFYGEDMKEKAFCLDPD